jgi:hypothetical protein
MTDIQVKQDTTVPLDVTLPRDISDATDITVHVGQESTQSATARVVSAESNTIAIPFDQLDLETTTYPIEFEISYESGYTETIPGDGYDYLHVYEDLG